MTEESAEPGPVTVDSTELKREEIWSYHCRGYPQEVIASKVGLSVRTVASYIRRMAARTGGHQEQGAEDLAVFLTQQSRVQSEAWGAIEELDRAREEEERRRQVINLQRMEEGKDPIPSAGYDKLSHWARNRALLLAQAARASERVAHVQGLFSEARHDDAASKKLIEELDERMQRTVKVELPDSREVPREWLPVEDRTALEEADRAKADVAPEGDAFARADALVERMDKLNERLKGT